MAHNHHFTQEELTERFVFTSKLKNYVFGLMGIGLVMVLVGAFLASSGDHGDGHHEDGHHGSVIEQTTEGNITLVGDPEGGHGDAGHGDGHAEAGHGEGDHGGGHAHHHVTWYTPIIASFLHSNIYFLTLAMGAMFFIMVHRLTNAGWQTAIRRVPEAMWQYLPVAVVGFGLILFLGSELYDWLALEEGADRLIDEKRAYLNWPFWALRTAIFFGVWFFLGYRFRQLSIKQDTEGGLDHFDKHLSLSAFFVIFFAITYCLFAVDWIKSLEPHWFSTIFGVYVFAGSMASAMTVIGLLLYFLQRQGYMSYINDSHFHDVYKYVFGFSIFWGYIWLSQFLLIWYANIPEEGFYYVKRMRIGDPTYEGYAVWFYLNIFFCWAVPFFGLMTRNAKRNPKIFLWVSAGVLIGHFIDLYQMIMPGAVRTNWQIGFVEVGFFILFAGIFLYFVLNALTKANLVPLKDPYTEESLHHSTGAV
ncbi:MAG: hypothetical protein AAGI38_07870 [Bacteroidota bacterium]